LPTPCADNSKPSTAAIVVEVVLVDVLVVDVLLVEVVLCGTEVVVTTGQEVVVAAPPPSLPQAAMAKGASANGASNRERWGDVRMP
jgi:hypothetical protein